MIMDGYFLHTLMFSHYSLCYNSQQSATGQTHWSWEMLLAPATVNCSVHEGLLPSSHINCQLTWLTSPRRNGTHCDGTLEEMSSLRNQQLKLQPRQTCCCFQLPRFRRCTVTGSFSQHHGREDNRSIWVQACCHRDKVTYFFFLYV